jgi:hypothetical protein
MSLVWMMVALFISNIAYVFPPKAKVRMDILREAHCTPYIIHPCETKMYQDLKQSFWWKRMNVDIAKYVALC